jgi:hypothetical protein
MDVSLESVPRKGLLSERVSTLPSAQRSYISDRAQLVRKLVAKRGRKGTWSSAATRIVLAKDARRAVAVDTVTAELS